MVESEGDMSLKNPVTPPGIDAGTVRPVAQRLNHYATPGPYFHHSGSYIKRNVKQRVPATRYDHTGSNRKLRTAKILEHFSTHNTVQIQSYSEVKEAEYRAADRSVCRDATGCRSKVWG